MNNIAIPYDYNIICQVCRKKIKGSEALKDWRGFIVCKEDYETRHPLDIPSPKMPGQRALPFTSPEGTDVEVVVTPHALAESEGVPAGNFDTNNGTL